MSVMSDSCREFCFLCRRSRIVADSAVFTHGIRTLLTPFARLAKSSLCARGDFPVWTAAPREAFRGTELIGPFAVIIALAERVQRP